VSASAVEILRRQLREKFPQAMAFGPIVTDDKPTIYGREESCVVREEVNLGHWEKGPMLEEFPVGALSVVEAAGPGAGLGLVIADLLGESDDIGGPPQIVLVDGADGFDPASFSGLACARLLWVRCRNALEMVKAADWVVRDGNVPLVLLDATGLESRDLQSLPAAAWWRLKLGAEQTGTRLVVLTAGCSVAAARLRLHWSVELEMADFDTDREELARRLRQRPARQRQKG
jgi:hypothetical protein